MLPSIWSGFVLVWIYVLTKILKQKVIFTESGLPIGTEWYINITGRTFYCTSSSYIMYITSGTYSYAIGVTGYSVSPASGSVTILRSGVTIPVAFTPNTNNSESGIQSEKVDLFNSRSIF